MNHRLKCILFTFLLASIVVTAGCFDSKKEEPAKKQGMQPVPVTVVEVQPTNVKLSQEWSAQTVAQDAVEIRSRVEGFLQKRLFKEGSDVKKGDLLFTIDPSSFKEALTQAQANLDKAYADKKKADADLKRYAELYKQDVIAKEQYESFKTKSQTVAADVKSLKAVVNEAKINLGYTKITAPINGSIGAAQVNEGTLVSAGQTLLAKIVSTDPMYVKFAVSEHEYLNYATKKAAKQADESAEPQQKSIGLELVLADGSVYGQHGKLNMADPELDPKTGTLGIRLEFPNPDRILLPGQFCTVRLTKDNLSKDMLVIPQRAVISVQGATSVLAVSKDNTLESRPVTLGARAEKNIVVKSGLQAGDKVVVEGVQKLRAGMPVKPVVKKAQQ